MAEELLDQAKPTEKPGEEVFSPGACLLIFIAGSFAGLLLWPILALVTWVIGRLTTPEVGALFRSPGALLCNSLAQISVLWVLRKHRATKPLWSRAEAGTRATWAVVIGGYLLAQGVVILCTYFLDVPSNVTTMMSWDEPGWRFWAPWAVLLVGAGILAPVSEEWLFRGIIQPSLTRSWGPWVGIGVTSVVFGLLHGLTQMVWTTFMGLILGVIAHRSRTLTRPVLLHVLFNVISTLVMAVLRRA